MASNPPSAASASLQARLAPFEALDACHRQVIEMLQLLGQMVTRLEHEGVDEHARKMARQVMQFFNDTARVHHEDEERAVFPALLSGSDKSMVQHIRRLQQDHGWLEEDWKQLVLQISAVADGYSWYDIDTLRSQVEVFMALYHDHIDLEESLIYPEAKRAIAEDAQGVGRRLAGQKRQTQAAP